jgi:hypothetical protein
VDLGRDSHACTTNRWKRLGFSGQVEHKVTHVMIVRQGETDASNMPRMNRLSIAVWKFVHCETDWFQYSA